MYIRSAPVVCVCIFILVHFYCCRRIGLFAYFSKCVSVLSCVYICLRLHFASIIIWVCICDSIPVSMCANCLLQKQSISRHVRILFHLLLSRKLKVVPYGLVGWVAEELNIHRSFGHLHFVEIQLRSSQNLSKTNSSTLRATAFAKRVL